MTVYKSVGSRSSSSCLLIRITFASTEFTFASTIYLCQYRVPFAYTFTNKEFYSIRFKLLTSKGTSEGIGQPSIASIYSLTIYPSSIGTFRILQIEPHCTVNQLTHTCSIQRPTGQRGRPGYDIFKVDESLFEMGFSYQQSARVIERTLRRRREEFGLPVGSSYNNNYYSQMSNVKFLQIKCQEVYRLKDTKNEHAFTIWIIRPTFVE